MRNGPKKIIEFAGKFCSFERRRYLCTTKPIRWIHLRVRIRASHARHRGSNPLSTTKNGDLAVAGSPFVFPLSIGVSRCRILARSCRSRPCGALSVFLTANIPVPYVRPVSFRSSTGATLCRCGWCGEGLVRIKCLSTGKTCRLVE